MAKTSAAQAAAIERGLLGQAINTILDLRRENALLRARVDTVDLMAKFLFAQPARGGGECVTQDVVYSLSKRIDELDLQATSKA